MTTFETNPISIAVALVTCLLVAGCPETGLRGLTCDTVYGEDRSGYHIRRVSTHSTKTS